MTLEFTNKQFRRLLDLVYIGNWILNSTRGEDRFQDYDDLESKLFGLCRSNGMDILVEDWEASPSPPRPIRKAAYTKPSPITRTTSFMRS